MDHRTTELSLARRVLAHHPLEPVRMRLVSRSFNTVYRVWDRTGAQFALRLGRPGWSSVLDIASATAWTDAIRRDTDLIVPQVARTVAGAAVVTEVDANGHERNCVLERWIEGRGVRHRSSRRLWWRIGRLLAELHEHADRFTQPDPFSGRTLDRLWRGVTPVALTDRRRDATLPGALPGVAREAAGIAQTEYDRLADGDPSGRRFLHIDLHQGNVTYVDGRLAALDFDDSAWAHPVQDLAICLHSMVARPDRDGSSRAFRAGYETLRAWPERTPGQIDRLILAREVEVLGFVLNEQLLDGDRLTQWLAGSQERLRLLLSDVRSGAQAGSD